MPVERVLVSYACPCGAEVGVNALVASARCGGCGAERDLSPSWESISAIGVDSDEDWPLGVEREVDCTEATCPRCEQPIPEAEIAATEARRVYLHPCGAPITMRPAPSFTASLWSKGVVVGEDPERLEGATPTAGSARPFFYWLDPVEVKRLEEESAAQRDEQTLGRFQSNKREELLAKDAKEVGGYVWGLALSGAPLVALAPWLLQDVFQVRAAPVAAWGVRLLGVALLALAVYALTLVRARAARLRRARPAVARRRGSGAYCIDLDGKRHVVDVKPRSGRTELVVLVDADQPTRVLLTDD